jgi:serine protease Do
VQPGSPADQAGIQQGDIIIEVNRQTVESVKEVKEEVAKAGTDSLVLLVKGEQGSRYVVLKG